jgi:ElaB/YqjD/DUF883 family membrane-anchored ribosome-binding protein
MKIPFGRSAPPQQEQAGGNGSAGGAGAGPTSGTSGTSMAGEPASHHRNWTRSDEANRSEFGAFLDDLSDLARGGGHSVELREELERRVHQAREQLNSALDHGMEMSVRARDSMQHGIEYTRGMVSERPIAYVAIAAGVGMLVGMLIAHRR